MSEGSTDRPATIYDVARLAGVSSQTVTRYVRGFEGISPKTRSKVRDAIDELGWKPNPLARALRTQAPTRILLFVHEVNETGPSNIILSATRAAAAAGYVLEVVPLEVNNKQASSAALANADQAYVAGAMAFAPTDDLVELFDNFPFSVPLLREVNGDGIEGPHAQGPMEPGTVLAAEHLHTLGHRDVFLINGPDSWYSSRKRRAAAHETAARLGMRIAGEASGDWSAASGHGAVSALPAHATAIIAANDEMAIGALSALHDRGIGVPGQISVVGFDDIPLAAYTFPALTTVRRDFKASGQIAIQRLLDMIAPEKCASQPHSQPVPDQLVCRNSTARARSRVA